MLTPVQAKEQPISDTPLLLFDCVFNSGLTEHWSTHAVTVGGVAYAARILKQNVFESQFGSDLGVDTIPQITVELANADSHFSEIERSVGVKGAQITVSLVFYNFPSASASTNTQLLFKGVLNPPDLVTEEVFRVSAGNRLSLQRVILPPTRIQKRCPWDFPSTLSQRQEALSGGASGSYSRFYPCGYSPDIAGGVGNLDPTGQPYTSCAYTRSDCTLRGMFMADSSSRPTARFGGIEFVPSTILVRSTGERGSHLSPVDDNLARYNDFVPLIYGTAWFNPCIVFARNDGNLTHFEVLLGMGQIQDIQQVLVNQIEIPVGQSGVNMTGTGWYNLISPGSRNGAFNPDFSDAHGNPLGDPYGSMAFLSVVVPNSINDGSTLPVIQVLLDGLRIAQYAQDGTNLGVSFCNNPAWIILDILQRIGWSLTEIDLAAFASTAAYCAEQIDATDLFGNPVLTPRFQCNVVLKTRRAASDLIRGVRNSSRLFLRYGSNGLLQLIVENSIAIQQPNPIPSSNAADSLNGGWPAYEFGDGTNGTTAIARTANRASSVKLSARSIADTPNRFVAEFQDAFNEYQQDSFSVVDVDDVTSTGQEVTSSLPVLGLPHFDQAARILQFYLTKSIYGNTTIQFQTSVKALGLSPGDIIAVTYLKEGFERQAFRVVKIQPGLNYVTASITAQIHDDNWYYDTNGQTPNSGTRRQGLFGLGLPRPLAGTVLDTNGDLQFGVVEKSSQAPDGTATVMASVSFSAPSVISIGAPDIPLVSLSPTIAATGGSLAGGQVLYYAVSSLGADGSESALSFVVLASLSGTGNTNSVTLTGLSFPNTATAFRVYRGSSPSNLTEIASSNPISTSFIDTGLPASSVLPPDPNYDHADFYWRLELQAAAAATISSATTIGNSILRMPPNAYAAMVVRIIQGTGFGQERTIASNTVDLITVTQPWTILPDSTSNFVVCEPTFQFGATSASSPIQFVIPNQAGNIIHISGRSANANGVECPYEISPLTRYAIGGAGIKNVDQAIPAAPIFGISLLDDAGGMIQFGPPGFSDVSNVSTVTTGTYNLYYLNELDFGVACTLTSAVAVTDQTILVSAPLPLPLPTHLYIDSEVVGLVSTDPTGLQLSVMRGLDQTNAAAHSAGASVYALQQATFVVPFMKNLFLTPASSTWSYPVSFPNARLISAELTVTNSQGNSPTSSLNFVQGSSGLRTLSGGQFSFQVGGFLAVQTGAAPDIVVDSPKVVNDAYAVVKQAPSGAPINIEIKLNGEPYFSLTIPVGSLSVAQPLDGTGLAAMKFKDQLSIDITSVGLTVPGSDLTVIIRM